ncbi:MAG: histidine kinase dimerization/phosphoacceptor domain -containing protein [Spirochaetia bacterium]
MLNEAHHRIKNSMAMVQGMLTLQADSSKEPGATSLLAEQHGGTLEYAVDGGACYHPTDPLLRPTVPL